MRRITKTLRLLEKGQLSDDGRYYYATGYASTFESPENADSHGDIFASGSWADDLAERGPGSDDNRYKALWQHRTDEPIGVISEAYEDERGLRVTLRISLRSAEGDPLQRGIETMALIEDGVIDSMSVGATVVKQEQVKGTKTKTGRPVNRITKARLWEVSPVTFPANKEARLDKEDDMTEDMKTKASLAGLAEALGEIAAARRLLRWALDDMLLEMGDQAQPELEVAVLKEMAALHEWLGEAIAERSGEMEMSAPEEPTEKQAEPAEEAAEASSNQDLEEVSKALGAFLVGHKMASLIDSLTE